MSADVWEADVLYAHKRQDENEILTGASTRRICSNIFFWFSTEQNTNVLTTTSTLLDGTMSMSSPEKIKENMKVQTKRAVHFVPLDFVCLILLR